MSDEPLYFRGESGANDSMIPLVDNLLGVTDRLPENALTKTLREFREYRPRNHHAFLEYILDASRRLNVAECAHHYAPLQYLQCLDRIREFRHRHWSFTKEYIIKHTTHPVATGGSPIVSWLPNQLKAVLQMMEGLVKVDEYLDKDEEFMWEDIQHKVKAENRVLQREVAFLKEKFGEIEA